MILNFPVFTGETVEYYGCCRCQAYHFAPDAEFQAHLYHQSKHGVKRLSRETYERQRAQHEEQAR